MSSIFESLKFHNYRIWFFAALVANTGTWMQRVAQDWLVLRILTDDSASATGLTTALQFLPALFLSAHSGLIADRVDQRRFLMVTQSAMGVISALLAVDVLAGRAQLWHVYVAAFAVFAVFIGEMVRKDRSGNRLEQIAGTYVGCLIALSGAFWVVLVDRLHGGLAPVVAVCILSGSLGRYATGARFERVRRSGWRIAWLTFYAYIGGLVLVFVIGPPYLLKAFVWVFGVALIYGVVAGLTDLAARSLKGCRVAISLAVVPHCALGVISYAAALFLS